MDTIFVKVAGFVIAIDFQKVEWPFLMEKAFRDSVFFYLQGFILLKPKKVDYRIEIIHSEKFKVFSDKKNLSHYINFYNETGKDRIITYYSVSSRQFAVILRDVYQKLLAKNKGFILHSAASVIKSKVNIFLGDSGAGKSTITNILSAKYLPLADDSIIIKNEESNYTCYQTPLEEKNLWIIKQSGGYKLKNIFFLHKSSEHKISKILDKELIYKRLVKQLLTDKESAGSQALILLGLVKEHNHFYDLYFSLNNSEKLLDMIGKV